MATSGALNSSHRPTPLSSLPFLCLACSCSLPPRRDERHFLTPCCARPICPTCLKANPRLARYNPCLHCLGGVQVVSARSPNPGAMGEMSPRNYDGGIHDDEVFAIGDDGDDREDDDSEGEIFNADEEEYGQTSTNPTTTPGPTDLQSTSEQSLPGVPKDQGDVEGPFAPSKYYIKSGDTLIGIALRFGIDGHHLCRMNSLPPSTLRTTPHLLHTRTFLILPPNARIPQYSVNPQEQSDHDARRARERAQKRLQVLTKEVDWRVAKAYVALADVDPNVDEAADLEYESKMMGKEKKVGSGRQAEETLEGRAIDRYLDDEEWEQRERREGRGVAIPKFPLSQGPRSRNTGRGGGSWWRWKN